MQQLLVELKNTPVDASQVHCSVNPALNSLQGEVNSVQDIVLANNNPDVNLHQPAGESKTNVLVYVLNQDGSPLMPCKPAKARHLIQQGYVSPNKA